MGTATDQTLLHLVHIAPFSHADQVLEPKGGQVLDRPATFYSL